MNFRRRSSKMKTAIITLKLDVDSPDENVLASAAAEVAEWLSNGIEAAGLEHGEFFVDWR